MHDDGELLQAHLSCDDCGSSDALSVYTYNTHCFSCETSHKVDGAAYIDEHGDPDTAKKGTTVKPIEYNNKLTKGRTTALRARSISKRAAATYGVTVGYKDGEPKAYIYPFFSREDDNKHIANKIRHLPKTFSSQGDMKHAGLFGQQLFPRGSAKYITICEGQDDALAAYEMQGFRFPCVSGTRGAGYLWKDVKANLEYLESFEKVYFCGDNDKKGHESVLKAAQYLSPGKAWIVHLDKDMKDANDYLVAGKQRAFVSTWWKAQLYTPAGILSSSEVKARIRNRKEVPSIPYPWDGLNKKLYGIRKGEAVTLAAPTGVGKTTFVRELEYNILQQDPNAKLGTILLEETPEESGLGLISMAGNIPFHLPDAEYTAQDYDEAEKILDEDRVFFYDSFGSNKIEEIVNRVRYYAKGLDCDYIFIDHLSIIVSDHVEGDERKLLDTIMTRLKTLTIELDIALICVVQLNRQGTIRGTAAIEQLSNTVIFLDRDLRNNDPRVRNTTNVVVYKNRFCGRTGPACALFYDENTGRMEEDDFLYTEEVREDDSSQSVHLQD